MQHFTSFFLSSQSNVPVKRALFLLNAALATGKAYCHSPTIATCYNSTTLSPDLVCKLVLHIVRLQQSLKPGRSSFIHPFIHSFIHPFIHSFIHSSIPSFIHSSLHPFIYSFIPSFIHSSLHLFIHPFIPSFIH